MSNDLHYQIFFYLHRGSTCIQTFSDYSKNLLFTWVHIWPFLSHVLAWNQIDCLQSRGTSRKLHFFHFHFSSGMITIRAQWYLELKSKHTTGEEYWHHGQQSLRCKLIDFRWNSTIALQPYCFSVLSQSTEAHVNQ